MRNIQTLCGRSSLVVRVVVRTTYHLTHIRTQTKVAEARAEKDAEEDRLRARLSQLKAELDSVKNKTVPEWVSTVDVATGVVSLAPQYRQAS